MACESSLSLACHVPPVTLVNGSYPSRAEYTEGWSLFLLSHFTGHGIFLTLTLYSDSHLPTLRLEIDVIILILCKVQVGVINDSNF